MARRCCSRHRPSAQRPQPSRTCCLAASGESKRRNVQTRGTRQREAGVTRRSLAPIPGEQVCCSPHAGVSSAASIQSPNGAPPAAPTPNHTSEQAEIQDVPLQCAVAHKDGACRGCSVIRNGRANPDANILNCKQGKSNAPRHHQKLCGDAKLITGRLIGPRAGPPDASRDPWHAPGVRRGPQANQHSKPSLAV
jgi:hypothetical protein